MPKVALTEAQRRRQRYERKSAALADGLATFKRRERLNNEQLAAELSMGKNSITKLLGCEDVMMTPTTFWQLLEIAGLEVKPRAVSLE